MPIQIGKFSGLNDTDPAAALDNSEAQDALNVESSLNGQAILKRSGYRVQQALTLSTAPVNGSFSFTDANGNRQDIACQDHYCSKSTNLAGFSVFLSTGGGVSCIPTRWSFAQNNGVMWGGNDCHDPIFQYDGTTLSYPATMPQGAVLELTKDRLVIADVTSNPNGVYYSQSGTFTNFTTGINSADPYVDSIGSPGDRVRALKYSIGNLFIFKTNSVTACILGDQYSSRCYPVSNNIGTIDPLAIVEAPGAIYFRGQDRNFWRIDNGGLTLVSKKISSLVNSQASGSVQSNTQTGQADWQAGTQFPSGSFNTTTTPGSVFPSSVSFSDTGFPGTLTQASTITATIQASSATMTPSGVNADFESGATNWTLSAAGGDCTVSGNSSSVATDSSIEGSKLGKISVTACAQNPTTFVCATANTPKLTYSILNGSGATLIGPTALAATSSTKTVTVDLSGQTTNYVIVKFNGTPGSGSATATMKAGFPINAHGKLQFKYISTGPSGPACNVAGGDNQFYTFKFDIIQTDYYNSTSTYISPIFDTGFSTTVGGPFSSTTTTPGGATAYFDTRSSTSPSNDLWTSWVPTSDTLRVAEINRYWQYRLRGTSASTNTFTVSGVSLKAATTGQFATECVQPGSLISGWGTLNCSQTTAGAGSLVFYATSAASCATLPSTQPSSWQTSVTNNATLSISTNAAVYIGWRSLLGSATDQAQVDDCTLYWENGSVSPPSWGTYDSLKNAIYWTSAINNSATNNRVLKYDLNLDQWYPFSLNANAIRYIQGTTYFGDSSGGNWNKYGGSNSDNGSSISAYWKSKDFGGTLPFNEKQFNRVSIVTKNEQAGTLTTTYQPSNQSSGSFSLSLSTDSTKTYVRANYNLPLLSPSQFLNLKFSNSSSVPFEIDGVQIDYVTLPWRAQNP